MASQIMHGMQPHESPCESDAAHAGTPWYEGAESSSQQTVYFFPENFAFLIVFCLQCRWMWPSHIAVDDAFHQAQR